MTDILTAIHDTLIGLQTFGQTLARNFGIIWGINDGWAGTIVAFILTASIVVGVYIIARSEENQHRTNTWLAVAFVGSLIGFTYPLGLIPLWYGLIMCFGISIVVGYGISKTSRTES